jgi:hypothetical protein
MPGSTFTVTPTPPTVLKLAPGEEGRFSFTVTALAAPDKIHDVTLRALVDKNGKREEVGWLNVEPQRTLSMPGGTTEVVTIFATPTNKTPPGENRIQLAVADNERPHDNYSYSAPVICDIVPLGTTKTEPEKPRLPRWMIPAIAGAVLLGLLGIVIALFGINNRSELRMFDQRLRWLETTGQPRKLCSSVFASSSRDTIEVDRHWTPATCERWSRMVDGRTFQLGCLLPDGQFSVGPPNGGQPTPNCGW